jgi:hypothetical protein
VLLADGSGATGRAKAAGAQGALLYAFVGDRAPATLDDFKPAGQATRPTADVHFDYSLPPGTSVFITARWYNARGQAGVAAAPVRTYLVGGELRLAA